MGPNSLTIKLLQSIYQEFDEYAPLLINDTLFKKLEVLSDRAAKLSTDITNLRSLATEFRIELERASQAKKNNSIKTIIIKWIFLSFLKTNALIHYNN